MGLGPGQPGSIVCAPNCQLCRLSDKTSLRMMVVFFFFWISIGPLQFLPQGLSRGDPWRIFRKTLLSFYHLFFSRMAVFSFPPNFSHGMISMLLVLPWGACQFQLYYEKHLRFKVSSTWATISALLLTSCIYLSRYFISLLRRGFYICYMGLILSSLGSLWRWAKDS